MMEFGEEYFRIKGEEFKSELESGKFDRAIAAHLGIRDHYVVRNGKKIAYPSGCDHDCADEHRLFNGRDCPNRVSCLIENGDIRTLPKSAVKEYEAGIDKGFKAASKYLGDLFLGNQH